MTDIYEFLKPIKGFAYKESQIKDHSLVNLEIPKDKKIKGNSRIHGDISYEDFKSIVDIIISLGSRFNLEYKEIAYSLLICSAESGFNPDAAAGTTSAAGLAQYTKDTVDAFKKRSKSILGVEIDMSGSRVFDATIGAYGVITAFLFNKELALKWGFNQNDEKYWQLIYMLHHDGPGYYNDDRGKERALNFKWRSDAVNTYNRVFDSKLGLLTKLLGDNVNTKLKLTGSDGVGVENKNYILAAPLHSTTIKPNHLSMNRTDNKKPKVVFGKTNSKGETQTISSRIGDEIITILLPDNFRELLKTNSNDVYTVKQGDNLNKIAKKTGGTVKEIANENDIKDVNKIVVGQKIKVKKFLRHQPANSVIKDIFNGLGIGNINLNILSFSKNHTAKPKSSNSNSTQKNNSNIIEVRSLISAEAAKPKENIEPKKEENKTQEQGHTKQVTVEINVGMAIIYTFQDTSYGFSETPKNGYTVFYDHLGNKIFSFSTGNKVASKSKSGADGSFSGYFTYVSGGKRNSNLGNAYGTTKIRTTDSRARWIHGGGEWT